MKESDNKNPWLPVTLLIAGLVLGYGYVTTTSGSAEAAGASCPSAHAQK